MVKHDFYQPGHLIKIIAIKEKYHKERKQLQIVLLPQLN